MVRAQTSQGNVSTMKPNHPTENLFISRSGDVYAEFRGRPGDWRKKATHADRDGYLRVHVGRRKCYVHRLVLEAHVGPCPTGKEADHIDRCRTNNDLTNLRWVSRAEQMKNRNVATGSRNGNHRSSPNRRIE